MSQQPEPSVPWIDLRPQTDAIRPELEGRWNALVAAGAFSGGPETARFEDEFAAYLGVSHVVGCSDGTSALVLALRASGIEPGDEVITAPNSFFATAEAIVLAGGRPVFADLEPGGPNLDPLAVESAITPRTTALLAVHLTGRPAALGPLRDIADRKGLLLLEDAAQAHGATIGRQKVGSLGNAAGFSFYPTKNLGAFGEGGAVATSDDRVASRARALRDHGQGSRNRHGEIGYNSRLDGLQSAVLRLKLRRLDGWNAERRALAARYAEALRGLPVLLPSDPVGGTHVYHLFPLQTARRADLETHLSAQGIGTSRHYPTPIHLQPAFTGLGHRRGSFPEAERYSEQQVSLPLYPGMSPSTADRVAEAIRGFFRPA